MNQHCSIHPQQCHCGSNEPEDNITHIYNPVVQEHEREVLLAHAATRLGVFRFTQETRGDANLQQTIPRIVQILTNALGNEQEAEIHLHFLVESEFSSDDDDYNLFG